jgi:hypothetical protein
MLCRTWQLLKVVHYRGGRLRGNFGRTGVSPVKRGFAGEKNGSSLKSMGNPVWNMIEIRNQDIEEVDTDRYEGHRTFSVGIGFEAAMVCGVL